MQQYCDVLNSAQERVIAEVSVQIVIWMINYLRDSSKLLLLYHVNGMLENKGIFFISVALHMAMCCNKQEQGNEEERPPLTLFFRSCSLLYQFDNTVKASNIGVLLAVLNLLVGIEKLQK